MNWEDDGCEIKQAIVDRYPYLDGQWQWVAKNAWYGREGITYSYLTSGAFSARRLEAGTIFDVAGASLFPDDPLALLGILNSTVAGRLLHAINPTVDFQVEICPIAGAKNIAHEFGEEVDRAIDSRRIRSLRGNQRRFCSTGAVEHAGRNATAVHDCKGRTIDQQNCRRALWNQTDAGQPD